MSIFIQNDATGAGSGALDPNEGATNLASIANGDTGLGLAAAVGDRQQVTYARTLGGACPVRLDSLVNTVFQVDYGQGAGLQTVKIVVLPCLANFFLSDASSVQSRGGVTLPPQGSNLAGASLNNTNDCLIIYDTTQHNNDGYCVTRQGTNGTQDLPTPNAVILYHELSHAKRIVTNAVLALSVNCNPAPPEESAAMTDENDMRTQLATALQQPIKLRDPNNYCAHIGTNGSCGTCCIIASVASGSPISSEVQELRALRDGLLRASEVGYAFFQQFFFDYYAFSPQICTMMAGEPALSPVVLNGFVRPLLRSLQMLKAFAVDGADDAHLGALFSDMHPDISENAETIAALAQVDEFWTERIPAQAGLAREISELLKRRALPSGHIQWALVRPVRIYAQALQFLTASAPPDRIGGYIRQAFTDWAGAIPIDHVWASLTASQVKSELEAYEALVLRQPESRARFRKRLATQFRDITAIQSVVGEAFVTGGELHG